MMITRRAFNTALSLTGLAAVAGLSPWHFVSEAMAQSQIAADLAKPPSLPDMALGPKDAAVTIVEYASMTCPHCAAFTEQVFPKIKEAYIDTNKIRFVFREFPLDIKAAAGSMLARCIAKDDPQKYFAAIHTLFKQQETWVMGKTSEQLALIGKQAGLSEADVDKCLKDQALLDKIAADQKFANEKLKVNSTPTFFINGEMIKGETSFEEFDKRIKAILKT
ncbi:MAG: DsbA family protein [Xanthobacteraceae bacterium]|nr:DsbA family protein [Hyphomicrobiales bacterium]